MKNLMLKIKIFKTITQRSFLTLKFAFYIIIITIPWEKRKFPMFSSSIWWAMNRSDNNFIIQTARPINYDISKSLRRKFSLYLIVG